MEANISRVNSKFVLASRRDLVPFDNILEDLLATLLKLVPEVNFLMFFVFVNSSSLEISDGLAVESQSSPVQNVGLLSFSLDDFELSIKGFRAHLGLIRVFHPVDREQVTKTRTNLLTVNLIIRRAIGSP